MTEYRIDDLAREAGTTTRNVRVYLENGLLARPQRRGRVSIYTDRHLSQLRAVTKLLKDGFTVKHILKFVTGLQSGQGLVEVLDLADLGELVTSPWSHPESRTMTRAQLEERLGALDELALRQLCSSGVIQPTADDDSYLVPDRRVVDDCATLMSRGIPLTAVLETTTAVDAKLDEAARTLTRGAHSEIVRQRGAGWYPGNDVELGWAADLIDVMRRIARRSAHASLDRALDEAVRAEMREYRQTDEAVSGPQKSTPA